MKSQIRCYRTVGIAIMTTLLAACGGSQSPIGARVVPNPGNDSLPYHKTFHYTGARQTFVVPSGVTSISVELLGASGGYVAYYGDHGRGARVHAVIPVQAREHLYIFVGGQASEYGLGGFNGGGTPGRCCYDGNGGGGGASDIREHGDKLRDRIVVAGGGGGQGGPKWGGSGGAGGGLIGKSGGDGGTYASAGSGGTGGTQSNGGSYGIGGTGSEYYGSRENGGPGNPGIRGAGGSGGLGGDGGSSDTYGGAGGGGGGGYYGGGGGGGGAGGRRTGHGSSGGGGGGGSSYVEPNAIKFHMWHGWKTATGNGLVVISW